MAQHESRLAKNRRPASSRGLTSESGKIGKNPLGGQPGG
nr:MAG TPA: hypothetical protein [Caudoviricetes sp.]